MNKEMFWQLIDESREACKDNIKGMAKYLEGRLSGLSLDEVKSYCGIFDTYHRAAGLDGVASVGNLMNHEMLTDDGFTDFRNWLIAQGKEIYLETMKNPEILAEKAGEPIEGWYEFELLGYAGMRIVEQMTGDFKQSCMANMQINNYPWKSFKAGSRNLPKDLLKRTKSTTWKVN